MSGCAGIFKGEALINFTKFFAGLTLGVWKIAKAIIWLTVLGLFLYLILLDLLPIGREATLGAK